MKAAVLLIAAAAMTGAQAQAECLSHGDARALFTMALPDAIDGLVSRCAGALPPQAFLPTQGPALAERYRHEAPFDPARARHAIQVASGQDLSFLADDATVAKLAHEFIVRAVEKKVQTGDCRTVDGLISLAAPLHADDMARALMLALELGGSDITIGRVEICGRHDEGTPR